MTLIDHDFISVWFSWCEDAERLSKNWPIKQEWRSIDGAEFNSKAKEYLLKKSLSNKLKNRGFFSKNEASKIYSIIKISTGRAEPNRPSGLGRLARRCFIASRSRSEICNHWTSMKVLETSITAVKSTII